MPKVLYSFTEHIYGRIIKCYNERKILEERIMNYKATKILVGAALGCITTVSYYHLFNGMVNHEFELQNTIDTYQRQNEAMEVTISNLQDELQVTQESLTIAEETLSRFTSPIKYDCAAAPAYNVPLDKELQKYTYDMCRYYGIEDQYEVVLAVMWRESNFTPDAISSTDDYGIMQINKCNHEYLYSTLGITDIMDTKDNIHGGVYILSTLFSKYETTSKVLMAYNMGPGGASSLWSEGIYTSAYSKDVLDKAALIEQNNYNLE